MDPLLCLPKELFLHILSFVQVEDILSLRKTCRSLLQSTKNSSLWIDYLHREQSFLPLPRGARSSDDLSVYTASDLEAIVLDAHKADMRWHSPRERSSKSLGKIGDSIIYVDLFLDRWLIAVYCDSVVGLWDIEHKGLDNLCSSMTFSGGLCMSSVASLNTEENAIIVAITGSYRTCILRIELERGHPMHFEEILTIQVSPMETVRALCPESHLAAFSRLNFIDVLDWTTVKWLTIPTQPEDADELTYHWNGIIALKFCVNTILCVKARSIEVYPLPSVSRFHEVSVHGTGANPSTYDLQFAKQMLPETTFRKVSISSPKLSTVGSPPGHISTTFIAYDVLKGLFHFRITINFDSSSHLGPTSPPPGLTTELIGVHDMMRHQSDSDLDMSNNPSMDSLFQNGRYPAVTRGFLSACCLGPEGKRGLWIERTRSNLKRAVVAFSIDSTDIKPVPVEVAFPTLDPGGHDLESSQGNGSGIAGGDSDIDSASDDSVSTVGPVPDPWPDTCHINGYPVYMVRSYDLRDDLTHCTFSEVSGRIIVGTRNGSLELL